MPAHRTTRSRKKPTSPTATPSQPASGSTGSGPSVRVRMYRQGLGDCFLVTFHPGGNEVHMLIDCGSLGATTTGVDLKTVVADIRQTTKDHLHLLIATHEHQDHVCGFRNVNAEFKRITVDNVWLAWTEDPSDLLARQIAKYKDDLGTSLAAACCALDKAGASDSLSKELGKATRDILGFVGDPTALGAAGLATTINEAMNFVRTGFGTKARFLSPGGPVIEENWIPGFRFYVLGPPRSAAALSVLGDHESPELYHLASGLGAAAAFHAGDPHLDEAACEREMPFDIRFRLLATDPLVAPTLQDYLRKTQAWRRIDNDWLHAAADLALQLDSMTNNTSLALAVERVSDGRVLLFPADSQQGNILSWHDPSMKWTVKDGESTVDITAIDLLKRAVFYKVGHHSSHNATAKGKELELMQREDELVAFIPVDRAVALKRNPKDSWQMPARPLYLRLLEKCQGRVVRSDLGWADDSARAKDKQVEREFDGLADAATWTQWQKSQQSAKVTIGNLYVDYVLA